MAATNSYIQRTDDFVASLGVEAYRVGGSVRDEILGRRPKDADYIVRGIEFVNLGGRILKAGGKPSVIKDRERRPLGWRVRVGTQAIEITLPRKEISTGPGHRDFDIVMDPELGLHEDAQRRDFTFNALYKLVAAPEGVGGVGEIADPTSRGLYDLQHKLICTTHPDSFRDDPLRILRALRFASVLGYDLNSETLDQMHEHAAAVTGLMTPERKATFREELPDGSVISRKRMPGDTARKASVSGTVFEEMSKLLMGDDVAKALRVAASTGVLGTLFPELAPMIGFEQGSRYHDMTTDEHTFTALETAAKVDAPLRVRWALLFHDAGKPETAWTGDDGKLHYYARNPKDEVIDRFSGRLNLDHEEQSEWLWRAAAKRMNIPRELREDVATLIRHHMVGCTGKVKGSKVRRMRVQFGDGMAQHMLLHRMCDLSGKGNKNRAMIEHVAEQAKLLFAARDAGVPHTVKDLQVNGRDATELGLQAKQIGAALRAVLDEVVVDPDSQRLSRDWQLRRLEHYAKEAP